MKKALVFGAFDTKGAEFAYVMDCMRKTAPGIEIISVDVSARVHTPVFKPTVTNREVAEMAGADLEQLSAGERLGAVMAMMKGAELMVRKIVSEENIGCVLSLGGGSGTVVGMKTLSSLPLGLGKIMVSTIATSKTTAGFVEGNDIMVLNSIVDISGINGISAKVFKSAAAAAAGMCLMPDETEKADKKPIIGATMFGHTTPCVEAAKDWLEANGYEVLVFHANGAGGRTMEKFIRNGLIDAVLDITTTEWADTVCGGVCPGGEDRLSAANETGIPEIISIGALDMVNWGKKSDIPAIYDGRLYDGNDNSSLMRTSREENLIFAGKIAEKLNQRKEPAVLMIPLGGVSNMDKPSGSFWDPEADAALIHALKELINNPAIEIREFDMHINDERFGRACAEALDKLYRQRRGGEA